MQETWVPSLGQEDALEKGTAICSSIPAWRISWTEEPQGYRPRRHKESDMTEVTEYEHKHVLVVTKIQYRLHKHEKENKFCHEK